MVLSAFAEKARPTAAADVARGLGAAARPWDELRAHVAGTSPPVPGEWGYPGEKHGWSLRLKRKNRVLLKAAPGPGPSRRIGAPSRTSPRPSPRRHG